MPSAPYQLKSAASAQDAGSIAKAFVSDYAGDLFASLFPFEFYEFAFDNDLSFHSITYTPNGEATFYDVTRTLVTEFPVDIGGVTPELLADNDFNRKDISPGKAVSLFGVAWDHLFLSSNGYVSFGEADTDYTDSIYDHSTIPRISALFADLNPVFGGDIYYQKLSDRTVVTYGRVAACRRAFPSPKSRFPKSISPLSPCTTGSRRGHLNVGPPPRRSLGREKTSGISQPPGLAG